MDRNPSVAVIGGGYTGLSAADHIKKSNLDRKVVLFKARRVGHGASGPNGGQGINAAFLFGGLASRPYNGEKHQWLDYTRQEAGTEGGKPDGRPARAQSVGGMGRGHFT